MAGLHWAVKLRTVREVYRKFKPKLIVCDFDGTMTTTETITPLLSLAQKKWGPLELNGFKQQMEWYDAYHAVYRRALLSDLTKYREALIKGEKSWNVDELIPFFKACDDLEQESLTKLNANGKYLANLRLSEISDMFREYMRADVIELLQEFIHDNCIVKVLSHNWSSHSIYNALDHVIRHDNIICNELNCNENGISTGELFLKCVTSVDKLHYFLRWNKLYVRRYPHKTERLSMYIGDEKGDFFASCCADISVWMRTPQNQNFLEVVNDKYLMNKLELELPGDTFFVVDSWN